MQLILKKYLNTHNNIPNHIKELLKDRLKLNTFDKPLISKVS